MLNAVRSRLTYANVVATGALFVALGGGAYALSGVPDRSGVYHGCVHDQTRVLRVVGSSSSCRKAKTVRRGSRRIRIPGETAIAWNQQGRPGVNGANGTNGVNGANGANGATNVVVRTKTDANTTGANDVVDCNAGERAIGGGVNASAGTGSDDVVEASFPGIKGSGAAAPAGATPTSWRSAFKTALATDIIFYAICASP